MDIGNRIVGVRPLENYILEVEFQDKGRRLFDMKPYLNGDFFGELLDENYFNTVYLTDISIEWSNGQDMCPDVIFDESKPI